MSGTNLNLVHLKNAHICIEYLYSMLRSNYYFFEDINFERIEDNILFIGFTSGFNSIKES